MVQGYYTLEESATILGMSADDLKQLARKGEIRSFQDRGTWRFRIQDIQEISRRRADSSDLEIAAAPLPPMPKPTDSPAPRGAKAQAPEHEVFGLVGDDDQSINLGADIHLDKGPHSSAGKKSASSKRLAHPPGSDSDVRLVADGSDINFQVPADSDVKVGDAGPKSGPKSSAVGVGQKTPKPAKGTAKESGALDSGVRLVPLDSDSDVRIVGSAPDDSEVPIGIQPPRAATDSDIRLEGHVPARSGTGMEGLLTEEINLDEELKKEEAQRQQREDTPAKSQSAEPDFPKKSPFELSTSDFNLAPLEDDAKDKDSSSDFDLTPAGESSSPLELSSSEEFQLEMPSDEVALVDDRSSKLKGPTSGINLGHPADSGISLEQRGEAQDESEYELTLDPEAVTKPMTPKPSASKLVEEDSDSSEFELKLDVESGSTSDSDSEFELTLDDTGGLSPMESDSAEEGEKDIFETDFEVPALGEESGSQAVAVEDGDTALESSDFELAIGEDDSVVVEESGSEVVAIDDDELAVEEEPAPPRGRKKGKKKVAEDEDGDVVVEEDDDIIVEEEPALAAAIPQAPWGIFPVAVLFPCVIVMVLLGMLGIELVQTQQGYKPGMLTKAIGGLIDGKK